MTSQELEIGECYKVVQVNGELRFCKVSPWMSHADMVHRGEQATAAGMISVERTTWTVLDKWSMTLSVGMSQDLKDQISKELGKPLED
jgi:hypothetical protein